MRSRVRILLVALVAVATVTALTATGGSAKPVSHTASAKSVTLLYGTAPDYLDPQLSYTTQGGEADWVTYLGLYTYAHKNGVAGGAVIPGLATGAPKITNGGKLYTMTLRKGLVYSNGKKVKASDFTYSIERALKLNWGGDSFYTTTIVGATAYSTGKSKTISGISTNNAAGTIKIKLLAPYGAFENVLAFPSSGFVPTGTPMRNLSNTPPPGVGPYKITNVVPNQTWTGMINPHYAKEAIPGVPVGHVNVVAKVESNTATETEDVLSNSADLFDTGDQVSPSLLPQIQSQAGSRYTTVPYAQTYYFFLNTKIAPFNNQLAREAVSIGIDRPAIARLAGGNLQPGCYFLPPPIPGFPTKACPYGNPKSSGDIAKAKALVAKAGLTGAPVTVWGETRSPRQQYITYYTGLLNAIGFNATEKIIADATYFTTIGNLTTNAQTGFADWAQDFPNPGDFYLLLDKNSIQSTNNQNFSLVNDPHIQSTIGKLDQIPPSKLSSVAKQWQALDYYTAQKSYEVPFGYGIDPKFASSRVNYGALVVQSTYGWDWTSIKLK